MRAATKRWLALAGGVALVLAGVLVGMTTRERLRDPPREPEGGNQVRNVGRTPALGAGVRGRAAARRRPAQRLEDRTLISPAPAEGDEPRDPSPSGVAVLPEESEEDAILRMRREEELDEVDPEDETDAKGLLEEHRRRVAEEARRRSAATRPDVSQE